MQPYATSRTCFSGVTGGPLPNGYLVNHVAFAGRKIEAGNGENGKRRNKKIYDDPGVWTEKGKQEAARRTCYG
jgi:hypothetical protein